MPQNELLFARDSVWRHFEAIGAPSDEFLNFRLWKLLKCGVVFLGLASTIFSISPISKLVPQNELPFARNSVQRHLEAIGAPSDYFLNFRFWTIFKCDRVLLELTSNFFSITSISKYVPQNELLFARDSVRRLLEAIEAPSVEYLNFRFWA